MGHVERCNLLHSMVNRESCKISPRHVSFSVLAEKNENVFRPRRDLI